MKQFTIPLYSTIQRPVFPLEKWHYYNAMLDTGAKFPVWVEDEKTLENLGAELLLENIEFGGFGGTATGKLYKIPVFQMGDLIYPNLHIIACQLNMPCHIIISATMLSHLRYEVDDENHILNVTIPDQESNVRNLVIRDKNGNLQVFCSSGCLLSK